MINNSNFTKEQLIECAQENVDVWKTAMEYDHHKHYAAIRLQVAEIALAALTAEPAMYSMKKGEALDIDATSTCKEP